MQTKMLIQYAFINTIFNGVLIFYKIVYNKMNSYRYYT